MAQDVRLTRRIAATPDEIYDAWTDPMSVAEWMAPMPGSTAKATIDPRVGGRFHIDMIGHGQTIPHDGEYLRLERPRLIEFTWISMGTNQQRSIVSVELRAVGDDETELTLTHTLLPSDKAVEQHSDGWGKILDRLAEVMSRAGKSSRP